MSKSMVSKYISKKWDEISKDTVEYKAYNLGLAVAHYQFYDYLKIYAGQTEADRFVRNFAKSNEPYAVTLRDLISLGNKEPETYAEKLAEKIHKCKTN